MKNGVNGMEKYIFLIYFFHLFMHAFQSQQSASTFTKRLHLPTLLSTVPTYLTHAPT